MSNLRNKINDHFESKILDKNDVALLFSGGTDSLTCLFSLLDLQIIPTLYSFHMEGLIHKDIVVSKKVAEFFKLNHKIVEIKRDIKQLMYDTQNIILTFKTTRKTNVQCIYPFWHVIPDIKESIVISGLCADDLYGTAKSVAIKCAKDKDIFDQVRLKTLSNLYSSAYHPIKELIEKVYNKTFITPYREPEIIDFFMKLSWAELNKPKQKQIAYNAYKDYYEQLNVYRRNSNLQVGSGVREWHNELLKTELNKNNRLRVDEVYKDLGKELIK